MVDGWERSRVQSPPMEIFVELVDAILGFVRENLYLGLFLIVGIEEAGAPLPVPGDTLLVLAGYEMSQGRASLPLIILTVLAASLTGGSALYWLARWGGHPLIFRYGKYIHLKRKRLERIEAWMQRRSALTITLGRLVPGLRIATTVAAGAFEVPYRLYLLYTGISTIIWTLVYVFVGDLVGDQFGFLRDWIIANPTVVLVGLVVFIGTVVFIRIRSRGDESDDDTDEAEETGETLTVAAPIESQPRDVRD